MVLTDPALVPERHGSSPQHRVRNSREGSERAIGIRTDLDYFGDSEAFSLMLDGYLMSDYEFARGELSFLRGNEAPSKNFEAWDFGQRGLPARIRRKPRGIYRRQLTPAVIAS